MTLQYDVALQALSQFYGLVKTLHAVAAGVASQSVQFSWMRSEDDVLRQLLHPGTMTRQNVECIGIYHGRTGGSSQLGYQGDGGGFVGSQTRTDAHGAVVVGIHRFAEDGFLGIHLEHRFRHANLHNLVVALRRMGNHLSGSRSQARLGGQHGSTAHAVASGNDECRAHGSLVGKVATGLHQQADVVLFENTEFAFRLLDEFRRESDIQYLQSSQVYLVVCQHHRQLLLLQGQRQVGTDDIG